MGSFSKPDRRMPCTGVIIKSEQCELQNNFLRCCLQMPVCLWRLHKWQRVVLCHFLRLMLCSLVPGLYNRALFQVLPPRSGVNTWTGSVCGLKWPVLGGRWFSGISPIVWGVWVSPSSFFGMVCQRHLELAWIYMALAADGDVCPTSWRFPG